MKSILHVISGLSTGGAEQTLFNLLSGTLATRFQCHVISLLDEGSYGERMRACGAEVYTLGLRRSWPSPNDIWELRRIVQATNPSVIQGWMYHGNLAASVARTFA